MDGDCSHTIGFLLPGICPDCTHYDVLWLCRSILPCLSWRYPQQADISKNTLPLTAFVSDGLTGLSPAGGSWRASPYLFFATSNHWKQRERIHKNGYAVLKEQPGISFPYSSAELPLPLHSPLDPFFQKISQIPQNPHFPFMDVLMADSQFLCKFPLCPLIVKKFYDQLPVTCI